MFKVREKYRLLLQILYQYKNKEVMNELKYINQQLHPMILKKMIFFLFCVYVCVCMCALVLPTSEMVFKQVWQILLANSKVFALCVHIGQ